MPTPATNVLPDPDGVGGNGAGLGRIRCCNRAETEAGHTRTEQENNGARNARNRLDKRDFSTGQYLPESVDLTYKEGGAGSNLASPTQRKYRFAARPERGSGGPPLANAHCCQVRTTSVGSHIWKD
jgi:hypothetical protein